jgi:hypothetical protein
MLLSRFWYVLVALALGAALFVLSVAESMHNRAVRKMMGEGLSSDSQVVSWYLKDDARTRAAQLVKFAVDPTIARVLNKASQTEGKLEGADRDSVVAALKKVSKDIPEDWAFDAVFAIDRTGRVVGSIGNVQSEGGEDFELGGHPVVADALHGFVRDDTLVWGRVNRVVARPVELEAGGAPAGAVLGARIIDDKFAKELTERTGAALAFYVGGQRTAAAAPEGFPKVSLDQIVTDLDHVKADKDYLDKGRSPIREIGSDLAVQYTRLPGEAHVLGAGFAVARVFTPVTGLGGFLGAADDKDKASANWLLIAGSSLIAMLVGLLFSYLEHTVPLRKFAQEAYNLSSGKSDHLLPSRFRGFYRRIAAELNDGIDKLAASRGGVSRKAADLGKVLGELPAQPQMAAFAVPEFGVNESPSQAGLPPSVPTPPVTSRNFPTPPGRPTPPQRMGSGDGSAPSTGNPPQVAPQGEGEWPGIFDKFVQTKVQCGESIEGFTYEKFRETLLRNREAIVTRHSAQEVRFTVYVKEGRAALKASPVR